MTAGRISFRSSFLAFALVVVIIGHALTWSTAARGADKVIGLDAKTTLIAPGPQTERVIDLLSRIITIQRDFVTPIENLLLKGRVSSVLRPWKQGDKEELNVSMPAPVWRTFLLVQRGAKRRFEIDADQDWAKKISDGKSFRVCNGQDFYALNPNDLEILPIRSLDKQWSDYVYDFSAMLQVDDGKALAPVADVCTTHIERLRVTGSENYFTEFGRRLRCFMDEGRLVVDLEPAPGKPFVTRSTFWLAPEFGYQVVKSRLEQGKAGEGRFSMRETKIEYKQIADSVFVPVRGTCVFSNLGAADKRGNRAGWGQKEMEVTDVSFGDFAYDDALFEVESLPVPKGAIVTDFRKKPPAVLTYRQGPLSAKVLEQASVTGAVIDTEESSSSLRTIIIAANVTIAVAVIAVLLLRRLRVHR